VRPYNLTSVLDRLDAQHERLVDEIDHCLRLVDRFERAETDAQDLTRAVQRLRASVKLHGDDERRLLPGLLPDVDLDAGAVDALVRDDRGIEPRGFGLDLHDTTCAALRAIAVRLRDYLAAEARVLLALRAGRGMDRREVAAR
jgi:hypothetical protein